MLAVTDPRAAIDFYERAFNATIDWHLDRVIAGMRIDGAPFFLAEQSPQYGTRGPSAAGFTTVRIDRRPRRRSPPGSRRRSDEP